jgi:general secretion pathway protein D
MRIPPSILSGSPLSEKESVELLESKEKEEVSGLPRSMEVPPLKSDKSVRQPVVDADLPFSKTKQVQVAFDKMPVNEFINHVFGDVLAVNYICSDQVAGNTKVVTLNIKEPVTEARLFDLVKDLLLQSKIEIVCKQGLFYLWPQGAERQELSVGVGRQASDVPEVTGDILQLIPLQYGDVRDMIVMVTDFLKVNARPYPKENVLAVRGSRTEVESTIELLSLLDRPAMRGRHVGFYTFEYADLADIAAVLSDALVQEGIPVSKTPGLNGLYLLPVWRLNALIVFSAERSWLERVSAWVRLLDVPSPSEEKSYYIYTPEHATAADLSASLSTILGVGGELTMPAGQQPQKPTYQQGGPAASVGGGIDLSHGANQAQPSSSGQPPPGRGAQRAAPYQQTGAGIQFAVDPNRNTLVFYSTAAEYQRIRRLLQKLDRMPVQIVIDATVLEVTMKDAFAFGIEWALINKDFSINTNVGLPAGTLNLLGVAKDKDFNIKLSAALQKDLVKILFSPKLTVKDGSSASMMVGTEVPVVTGEATTPDLGGGDTPSILRSIQYRNTGIILNVTPTVNAHGAVTLDIKQEVSDASQNETSNIDSPTILNRSIATKVVTGDGQTVVLGGLIRENISTGETSVPGAGSIPILGQLFKRQSKSITRTELVLLITPRVIRSSDQIDTVREEIMSAFKAFEMW